MLSVLVKCFNISKKTYFLLSYFLVSQLLSNKKVFVVTGMRRSGNHGFINWFSNALLEKKTEFDLVSKAVVNITKDGQLILFNEVNFKGGVSKFIFHIANQKANIKKAKYVIISLEDYSPQNRDPFIPRNAKKIAVQRSILNLIASRIKRATNQAAIGLDRGDMTIDGRFVRNYKWIAENNTREWIKWDYDLWMLNHDDYRHNFLERFGLSVDILPSISDQGGGSSFTGTDIVPTKDDTLKRWQMIEWPKRVLELLSMKENFYLLSENEQSFVSKQLNNKRK